MGFLAGLVRLVREELERWRKTVLKSLACRLNLSSLTALRLKSDRIENAMRIQIGIISSDSFERQCQNTKPNAIKWMQFNNLDKAG